ncbi:hypothetical protein ACIBX9_31250 [Streptomyces albidoflavus]
MNIAEHAAQRAAAGDGSHYVRGVAPGAMPEYVDGVITGEVPNVQVRYLKRGRVGYWDPDKGAVVIEDPGATGGTVFTPKNESSISTMNSSDSTNPSISDSSVLLEMSPERFGMVFQVAKELPNVSDRVIESQKCTRADASDLLRIFRRARGGIGETTVGVRFRLRAVP